MVNGVVPIPWGRNWNTYAATPHAARFPDRRLKRHDRASYNAAMADQQHIYRIYFHSQGQIYEVYAHAIYQSDLYGFVEIEDYIFGEKAQVVIDPAEDKLRTEFSGVQRSFVPMHAIIRIDEVEKEGTAKVTDSSGQNITPFPMPMPKNSGS